MLLIRTSRPRKVLPVSAEERLQQLLHDSSQTAWTTAALVTALRGTAGPVQLRAAQDVLRALDLDAQDATRGNDAEGAAAQAAAPVLQVAALLRGEADLWAGQSDEALLAQGRASAQGPRLMARFVFPALSGLSEALARPGARALDVGTGVGALAVAYAELFPQLTVVGIDVLPRVLALAESTVARCAVADRVVLRQQDVASLDEQDTYAMAWVPAPFVPEEPLTAGLRRIAEALVPGGWAVMGHSRFTGDALDDAINRYAILAFGGTALDDGQAQELLRAAGLSDVRTMPTPPGAPSLTVGRRPPA
jgi:SAM-dependent methyltransferase